MAQTLGADAERIPDGFGASGFAGVIGEAEAGGARFGVDGTKGLGAGASLVTAEADADDGGKLGAEFDGLADDTFRFGNGEVANSVEDPVNGEAQFAFCAVSGAFESREDGFEARGIVIAPHLISLDPDHAPDPAAMLRHAAPFWSRFEFAGCKVASQRSWRLAANWKLAVENTLECYHCMSGHPEYTAANAFVKSDEMPAGADAAKFATYQATWQAGLEGKIPLGRSGIVETGGQPCRAGTFPLAPGQATGSQDGKPLAPLLGKVAAFDESVTTGCIGFLTYLAAMCDHALLVTYVPQSADETLVVMKWLVRGDAREGVDYDDKQAPLALGDDDRAGQAPHRAQCRRSRDARLRAGTLLEAGSR